MGRRGEEEALAVQSVSRTWHKITGEQDGWLATSCHRMVKPRRIVVWGCVRGGKFCYECGTHTKEARGLRVQG